jgi:hypothetical protein
MRPTMAHIFLCDFHNLSSDFLHGAFEKKHEPEPGHPPWFPKTPGSALPGQVGRTEVCLEFS